MLTPKPWYPGLLSFVVKKQQRYADAREAFKRTINIRIHQLEEESKGRNEPQVEEEQEEEDGEEVHEEETKKITVAERIAIAQNNIGLSYFKQANPSSPAFIAK